MPHKRNNHERLGHMVSERLGHVVSEQRRTSQSLSSKMFDSNVLKWSIGVLKKRKERKGVSQKLKKKKGVNLHLK